MTQLMYSELTDTVYIVTGLHDKQDVTTEFETITAMREMRNGLLEQE